MDRTSLKVMFSYTLTKIGVYQAFDEIIQNLC